MAKSKPKRSGAARMRQLGFVGVTIWLTPAEADNLDRARGDYKRATWARAAVQNAIRQRWAKEGKR